MSACKHSKSNLILILCWRLELTDALINSDPAHKDKTLCLVSHFRSLFPTHCMGELA